jgi:hypothetical protein
MVAMNVWPTDALDGSVSNEPKWRKMARHWCPTGIADGVGTNMAPTLAFPNLTVGAGACWVDGHYCELPAQTMLTVTANGLAVVQFDPAANLAQLIWRDAATTPVQLPTGIWEVPIAKVTANALTDLRVNSLLTGQRIPSFATAAARATAIPAPVLNQLTMRADKPTVIEVWNGTAWVDQEVAQTVVPPAPVDLLFVRTVNQNVGSTGTGVYDIAFTMPRTGPIVLAANTAISFVFGAGDPPNMAQASIDNAGTFPAASAIMPAAGTLTTVYSAANLMFRAYWPSVAQGTVVTVRLSMWNVGGPGVINWSGTSGVINCGGNVVTF